MIWDAVTFQGIMELQIIQERQTTAGYDSMLERAFLLIVGPRLYGNNSIFQQCNAVIHNACRRKDIFLANNVIFWTSSGFPRPDHSENICGWMAREVCRNGYQFQASFQPVFCRPFLIFISTLRKRNFKVIHNDDHATDHWEVLLGILSSVYDLF